ncbi:MAG: phosphoribosyltransferase family protein [Sphingomicrobium sp.]
MASLPDQDPRLQPVRVDRAVHFAANGRADTSRRDAEDETHPAAQRNDMRQRGDEVRGVFSFSRKADIQGKRIILIDDALTTGSTADACAKALLKVGAADVEPFCFARVVRPAPFTR